MIYLVVTVQNYLCSTKLTWLYLDINSYFATIEQQVNGSLRNKPIAVLPVMSDTTCAIAVSQEAKLKGIKTGTKIYQAKKLCPDLICIPANHQIYKQYHQAIFNEVRKYIIIDHLVSIDEGCGRLDEAHSSKKAAELLAKQIKLAIKKNVGDYITCSIGIAPNRYLAKIATNIEKVDGLVVIMPGEIEQILYKIKLIDLPGIGKSTYNRLVEFGITSIKQLYNLDAKFLRRACGSIWGEKLYYLLRGVDLFTKAPKTSTISNSKVLAPNLRNIVDVKNVALNLMFKAVSRMQEKKLSASNIIVSLETTDRQYLKSTIKMSTLMKQDNNLEDAMLNALDRLLVASYMVKKVAIYLTNLKTESSQLSFFKI